MHRVFQSFIDGLSASTGAIDLQNVLTQAGRALDRVPSGKRLEFGVAQSPIT